MTPTPPCPLESGLNRSHSFAVVIPVYNHGGTVAKVVRKTLKQKLPVIVVDDGSTDQTYENIKSIPDIRILRHRYNLGKGAALVAGMIEASKSANWAISLDADGQHDPDDIPNMINAVPKNSRPIIIGQRTGMDNAPWTSRFGREFSNFWVRASGGAPLSDSQSGFRLYPLPEILQLGIKARRYQYEIEVIAKAAWQGIDTIEVPVSVNYAPFGRRISHFKPWHDFVRNTGTFSRLITTRLFSPRHWRIGRRKV